MKLYYILFVIELCFTLQACKFESMYIVPELSPNNNCNREPCITLSEFAASINITAKQSLIFLPGHHILDSNIYIFNVTQFSLILSGDFSSSVSITCQHNSRFKFENVGHVVIEYLTFLGCGNQQILSCGRLYLYWS